MRSLFVFVIGLTGLYLIGTQDGWWESLAVGLLFFAHQIEKHWPE